MTSNDKHSASNVNKFHLHQYTTTFTRNMLDIMLDIFIPDLVITRNVWKDLNKFISNIDSEDSRPNMIFTDALTGLCTRITFSITWNVWQQLPNSCIAYNIWMHRLKHINVDILEPMNSEVEIRVGDRYNLRYYISNVKLHARHCRSLIHVSKNKSITNECRSVIV